MKHFGVTLRSNFYGSDEEVVQYCTVLLQIIGEYCLVVENDKMRSTTGGIMVTHKIDLKLISKTTVAAVQSNLRNGVVLQGTRSANIGDGIMGVSQNASSR